MDQIKKCAAYIKQSLIYCSICQEVIKKPVLLQCNHCFCDTCLKKYLSNIKKNFCPNCNSPLNRRTIYNAPALDCTIFQNFLLRLATESKLNLSNIRAIEPPLIQYPNERYQIQNDYDVNDKMSIKRSKSNSKIHPNQSAKAVVVKINKYKRSTDKNTITGTNNNINLPLLDVKIKLTPLENCVDSLQKSKQSKQLTGVKRKTDQKENSPKKKLRSANKPIENLPETNIPLNQIKDISQSSQLSINNENITQNNSKSTPSTPVSLSDSTLQCSYRKQNMADQKLKQSFEKVKDWLTKQNKSENDLPTVKIGDDLNQISNKKSKSLNLTPIKSQSQILTRHSSSQLSTNNHSNKKINELVKNLEKNCLDNLQDNILDSKKNDWSRVKKELKRTPTFKKLDISLSKLSKTSPEHTNVISSDVVVNKTNENQQSNFQLERFIQLVDQLNDIILQNNVSYNTIIYDQIKNITLQLHKQIKMANFSKLLKSNKISLDKCTNTTNILNVHCPKCQHQFCIDNFHHDSTTHVNTTSNSLPILHLPYLDLTQKLNKAQNVEKQLESHDVVISEDIIRGTEQTQHVQVNRFFSHKTAHNRKTAKILNNSQIEELNNDAANKNIDEPVVETHESSSESNVDLIERTPEDKILKRRRTILISSSDSDIEYLSVIPATELTTHPPKSRKIRKKQSNQLDISLIEPIQTQSSSSIPVKEITPPPDFIDHETDINDVENTSHFKTSDLDNYSVLPETTIIKNVKTPKSKISLQKLKEAPILTKNFEEQQESSATTEKSQIGPTFCQSQKKPLINSRKIAPRNNSIDANHRRKSLTDNSISNSQSKEVLQIKKKKDMLMVHTGPSNFKQISVLNYLDKPKTSITNENRNISQILTPTQISETHKTPETPCEPLSTPRTPRTSRTPRTPSTPSTQTNRLHNITNKNTPLTYTPFTQNWKSPAVVTSTPKLSLINIKNKNKHDKMELIWTQLSTTEITVLTKFCSEFNVNFSTKISDTATHLVTQVNEQNMIEDLTVKFVCAVARGIWVVSFKWIEDCLSDNQLLPEEQYEVSYLGKNYGPKMSRLDGKPSRLFENFHMYIISDPTPFPMEKLKSCLKINGARIHETLESLIENQHGIPLIIADSSGESEEYTNMYQHYYDRYGIIIVGNEWIYQSIGRYRVESLAKYLLCNISELPEKYPLYLLSETQTESL